MAKRIYTSGNYLIVDEGGKLTNFPKNMTAFSETTDSFFIEAVNLPHQKEIGFTDLPNWKNGNGNAVLTKDSLRTLLRENTGFSTASGGSGALAVDSKYIFADNTARDNYFKTNPTEKTLGRIVVVRSPRLVVQRWNGATWDTSYLVLKGQDGVDGSDGQDGRDGTNGTDGRDGANGTDGIGITTITGATASDGTLIIQFGKTDGSTQQVRTGLKNGVDEQIIYIARFRKLGSRRGWLDIGSMKIDFSKYDIQKVEYYGIFNGMKNVADVSFLVRDNESAEGLFYAANVGKFDNGAKIGELAKASYTKVGVKQIDFLAQKSSNRGAYNHEGLKITLKLK